MKISMIEKVKNKIKEFENRFRKIDNANELNTYNLEIIESNQQILLDFNQLSQLFSENEFIPLTTFSISPSTILHLMNDLLLNEKKNVLEFGSGSSTLYIGKFLKSQKLNEVKFYSIETDKNWKEKIEGLAEQYGILKYINIVYAPLSEVENNIAYKTQTKWYGTTQLKKILQREQKFDLLLVDGPWKGHSPYVRYSAVPFLKDYLSDKVSIYLDDTFREEELEIINEWKDIMNLRLEHFNKYSLLSNEQTLKVQPFKLNKWKNP